MSVADVFTNAVGGFLEWLLVGIGSIVLLPLRVVQNNRRRSLEHRERLELDADGNTRLEQHEQRIRELEEMQARQERYWLGDENDPNNAGVLEEIHGMQADLEEIKHIVRNEHEYNTDD